MIQGCAYCSLGTQIEVISPSLGQNEFIAGFSLSTLHLIQVYPFMTLECDAPVLVKIFKFIKSTLSNLVDTVGD